MNILFFDTETTDTESGRLIQLAYKYPRGKQIPEAYSFLYKPPVPISISAMAVHHITEEMVENQPYFDSDKHWFQDLFDKHIMVAHNSPFDVGIMLNEGVTISTHIDTRRVAQHLIDSPSYALQYLRYHLKFKFDQPIKPHDALSDVIVLEELFWYLFRECEAELAAQGKVREQATDQAAFDQEVLNEMLYYSKTPVLIKIMPFGKHKGLEMARVPKDYLQWLNGQPELSEDLRYTLNHHLK